jgi:hypothetical protein
MIPKMAVGPGSETDSSILYYLHSYFILRSLLLYLLFYFLPSKMLSLYNFTLIVVICLITPSILQVEGRLASHEGL